MSAITTAMGARPCLVNSSKISHFGRKPVRGGSPAKESKIRGVRHVRAGIFDQEEASILIVVDLFKLNSIKVEKVIIT